ncbi:hypothetical protein G647_04168 [Cladophialophora carrionii CBS 160.54]|uniref:Lysine-specific metallo-endopeptidase domain-containing protein n=1 Tax=Cladophialophora carrionii CBS 160.54 TaxID=1279043 RepID=V9DEN4_9EURO|nr:uncharacterized protein G647_04168 [Cladophialophora carrionii CBS 160.54]ETI24798.1 hypothetical protein G647_04168 [Cladophialophora carrionii CBS 160.54]
MSPLAFLKTSLVIFVSLLLGLTAVSARESLVRPPNFPVIGGPQLPDAQIGLFYQSFQDAIFLAKHAAMYWPCDPTVDKTFLRYFRPENARFVKDIFRTIANIPLDLDLTDKDAVAQLAGQPLSYHPKYNRLSIYFLGDHPGLPTDPSARLFCGNSGKKQAHTRSEPDGSSALMSVCKVTFRSSPMLKDVTNPPAWAIDPNKDQTHKTQFYDGFGCENLGDTDSDYMDSPAAVVLHELLHFPGLFADVPSYAAMIPTRSGQPEHLIEDWWGPSPIDGYGAYNAMLISKTPPKDRNGRRFLPIYNADNYAWYAISSYFSRKCTKEFQDAPNDKAVWKNRHPPPWPFDVSPV